MLNQAKRQIKYVEGDATSPEGDDLKVIIHCCNDIGAWGAGFVLALSNKWEGPESKYRNWASRKDESFKLGAIQMVPVDAAKQIYVCNIIGQRGIRRINDAPPIRYPSLYEGMAKLASLRNETRDFSVHMPRIGCGLAGGDWNTVERIIEETLCEAGIKVVVYDLPAK